MKALQRSYVYAIGLTQERFPKIAQNKVCSVVKDLALAQYYNGFSGELSANSENQEKNQLYSSIVDELLLPESWPCLHQPATVSNEVEDDISAYLLGN